VHAHPSQSCSMCSVDLHTHASFQCMLPESFAVVCAPQSEPKCVIVFGSFCVHFSADVTCRRNFRMPTHVYLSCNISCCT
ncbi:hypothetical protein C8J57DRAFT_1089387, partial [Mycena rebaudengoi]